MDSKNSDPLKNVLKKKKKITVILFSFIHDLIAIMTRSSSNCTNETLRICFLRKYLK